MSYIDWWDQVTRRQPPTGAFLTAPVQGVDAPIVSSVPAAQMLTTGLVDGGELTIVSGLITITAPYHAVDTEGEAASDNLAGAYGGSEGVLFLIRPASDSRTVVVKHNDVAEGGDGTRFFLNGDADLTLDDIDDAVLFVWVADLDNALGGWMNVARGETLFQPQVLARVSLRG